MSAIIATLAPHPRRPERLALVKPNGIVVNSFAADATREEIAAALARQGFTLRDDDTVTQDTAETLLRQLVDCAEMSQDSLEPETVELLDRVHAYLNKGK